MNHNPRWRVMDESGREHIVQACDEVQALDFAQHILVAVVSVVLDE